MLVVSWTTRRVCWHYLGSWRFDHMCGGCSSNANLFACLVEIPSSPRDRMISISTRLRYSLIAFGESIHIFCRRAWIRGQFTSISRGGIRSPKSTSLTVQHSSDAYILDILAILTLAHNSWISSLQKRRVSHYIILAIFTIYFKRRLYLPVVLIHISSVSNWMDWIGLVVHTVVTSHGT